ncbi:MAG: DUF1080 domain-containing protein [Planctomycetia bacterium]|nr:DUF1080 domain-containing protein [Planctomycetia bacterium]
MKWANNRRGVPRGARRGATTTEYAVLLGMIGAAAGVGVLAVGAAVKGTVSGPPAISGSPNAAGTGSGTGSGGGGGGGSAPAGKLVYRDSFNNPKESNGRWDLNGSWWKVTDGALQVGPVSGWNEVRAYANGSSFEDGTVSMDATLSAGMGYGLFFHVSADPVKKSFNGYSFQYDPGYGKGEFVLRKWVNGVELSQPLAAAPPAGPYKWLGVQRHIEVTTQGSMIVAKVDGETVLSCVDGSFTKGGIGLRGWNNTYATFDNIQVTTPK